MLLEKLPQKINDAGFYKASPDSARIAGILYARKSVLIYWCFNADKRDGTERPMFAS